MAELQIGQQADFDAFYSLLEESFPTNEYRPRQAQRELLRNEAYTLVLVCEQGVLRIMSSGAALSERTFVAVKDTLYRDVYKVNA